MKYFKCLILAVLIALPMCACKVSAASPTENKPAPKETTAPDEVEEDFFQSDDFILVNSPDFEPFEFFGQAHLQTILEREGVNNGIDFFMRTKPESIKVGKLGDVVVGQVQMDDDDVVWNVRIEKADDFVNNTGIDMSNAENIIGGKDEIVSTIGGMTFITRKYRIDLPEL